MHAGLVAAYTPKGWLGTLILGPSGSGKSQLALRLIGAGWRLVADDRVTLWSSGGRLFGRAPATIHGLIEARGVGILSIPALDWCEIAAAVRLEDKPERIPEEARESFGGIALPIVRLASFDASAPDKLALRMQTIARLGASD